MTKWFQGSFKCVCGHQFWDVRPVADGDELPQPTICPKCKQVSGIAQKVDQRKARVRTGEERHRLTMTGPGRGLD